MKPLRINLKSMYTFGKEFRVTIAGESHGNAIIVAVEGLPAGIQISNETFQESIQSRKPSHSSQTDRREKDQPQLLTGIQNGITTGNPITIMIPNHDTRSRDYEPFRDHPRPGHADFTTLARRGPHGDIRGGGIASGRMTIAMVIAGQLAQLIIPQIRVQTRILRIGNEKSPDRWENTIERARRNGDSLGGQIQAQIHHVPPGWGEPFFDSIESIMAHILFAIPGVKAVEFGDGIHFAHKTGSQANDPHVNAIGAYTSNRNGGINGGISNGNTILFRVTLRAPASIPMPQNTFHAGENTMKPLAIKGRHDACYIPRALPVIQAAALIALAELHLRRKVR